MTLWEPDHNTTSVVVVNICKTADEFESFQTKQKLQMSEDDRRQQYDIKDLKTPEEVAKIIEVW